MERVPPSFTSSSSRWKIGQVILLALGFLVLYDLGIRAGVLKPGDGLSQNQKNDIRKERIIFGSVKDLDAVLVGSSLAARVKIEDLDPKFYNLGLLGDSSLSGCETLLLAEQLPKHVIVEVSDSLVRTKDLHDLRAAYNPTERWLSTTLPWTRQEYQPANVFIHKFKRKGSDVGGYSESARQRATETYRQRFLEPLTEEETQFFTMELQKLSERLAALEARGAKVHLFYIPGEKSVEEAPKRVGFLKLAQEHFAQTIFSWIPAPEQEEWKTTDGIHLIPEQAKFVAEYLATQVQASP